MNKIIIGIANKIVAVLLCIILSLSCVFVIVPQEHKVQESAFVICQEDTDNTIKVSKTKDKITSRGDISRNKVEKYTLYELILNDNDILYFNDINIANQKKDYILNNTINLTANVIEVVKEDNKVSEDFEIENVISDYLNKYKKPTTCFPTKSHNITSTFGKRSRGDYHTGIDLAGRYGDNIYAYKSGKVIKVQYSNKSYGNMVMIEHKDGSKTRYAHMSSIKVSMGQNVSCGETIGYMGSTGNSTGNHLHFEVIIDGIPVNPYNYIF